MTAPAHNLLTLFIIARRVRPGSQVGKITCYYGALSAHIRRKMRGATLITAVITSVKRAFHP